MAKDRLNFNTKLHLACSDDDIRPVMQCVHFKNGSAYASNGFMIIKQSLEFHFVENIENLEGKAIHAENFKMIIKYQFAKATDEGIDCVSEDGGKAFFPYHDISKEKPIDYDFIFGQVKTYDPVSYIDLTPSIVVNVIGSMYLPNGQLRLRFANEGSFIVADATGVDGQIAVIMPVVLQESLF